MVEAQKADFAVYDSFAQLEARISSERAPVLVVNFWATWCKPCVEELPYFEALQRKYKSRKVKVILVSLDFKSQQDKRLRPFLEERKMISEVVLLADQDADEWIPRINENWDGAIPVTLVFNRRKHKKGFHKDQFDNYCDLECYIKQFL
ncbi:MAG: TlpA family protein disulfide reductase [Lewinellaceae bacterium]|nr:TlpA family protein disulfide reductase [Lewinellaceae bacterium]